ncbi:MAG: hypothetical protein ACJ76J_03290 [Thermoanaerobaculia bacterium]
MSHTSLHPRPATCRPIPQFERKARARDGTGGAPLERMVKLAWIQGIFYFVTGVWPLVSIGTFMMVTGPKVDLWLVKTVGLLIAVIALAILMAARRGRIAPEVRFLAAGSAAALAAVDLIYALSDRIWDVYLLDAVAEIGLVVLWLVLSARSPRTASPPPRP